MIVIGEKINATVPEVKKIFLAQDREALLELAIEQAAAGSTYIDVNVGTGVGGQQHEMSAMKWAIETIQDEIDTPICIDSADPVILEEGLKAREGRPALINSVKAGDKKSEEIIGLAKRFNLPLVALAMNTSGIPKTCGDRLLACQQIVDQCHDIKFPLDHLYFDPLVVPISTDSQQGLLTLRTIREIKKKFPDTKTIIGLSNISYGLPARSKINSAFLHMAIYEGLDAVILDPLDEEVVQAVKTAEAISDRDCHFRRFMRSYRVN
ncbi:MAG: dihydropteroate synthase [Desulfobacteraceae bacterium]|nr:dihydropteroate synthase [Desulfobacteraceae bacterium]MBC2757928.1 dihydropteroate synthase [Desulfobacteraceae bacterium]